MGTGITTSQTNKQEFRRSQKHERDNEREENVVQDDERKKIIFPVKEKTCTCTVVKS
jgi:hypothetical protein